MSSERQLTPMGELIEWLDGFDSSVSLNITQIKAKVIEHLPAEQNMIENTWLQGQHEGSSAEHAEHTSSLHYFESKYRQE